MPIKLIAPIYKEFELEEIDLVYGSNDGEPTKVTIRQATQAQHEVRQRLLASNERKYRSNDPEAVTLTQNFSYEELMREEAWVTLVECNILGEDGLLLFKSKQNKYGRPQLAMTRESFYESWGSLFPDICEAIHKRILEVNPVWGPSGEV